jgi:hypothetical protein
MQGGDMTVLVGVGVIVFAMLLGLLAWGLANRAARAHFLFRAQGQSSRSGWYLTGAFFLGMFVVVLIDGATHLSQHDAGLLGGCYIIGFLGIVVAARLRRR